MRRFYSAFLALSFITVAQAQAAHAQSAPVTPSEQRAARAFETAKKAGAPQLYAFLKPFPKGADLHMHLSGAIYAETFIAEAAQSGLCVAPVDSAAGLGLPAVPTPQGAVRFVQPVEGQDSKPACPDRAVPASTALTNQKLYDALIDSFSMRAFVPSPGINGHDQFFATFDRFGGLKAYGDAWLDEVASRAAAQNEQYLEIMDTPSFSHAVAAGYKLGWPKGIDDSNYKTELARLRDALFSNGLRDDVPIDRKAFQDMDAGMKSIEHNQACIGISTFPPQPCTIQIRFLYQVLRAGAPQQVFAQTLLGFEVASVDPRVVGINFVQPEDGRVSMQEYHLQMLMLDYLHSAYPRVHISLHAGELAPGMVAPDGLRFHIREAVDLGHAERIGHGVDILYEDRPQELLKEMASKHIDVEINLTSNDGILGIKGSGHPLAAYRAARVPWSLSTDDEGVSRIDLTHEYVRGVVEQNLTYADLKQSARASLEHSFLSGESLYVAPDAFARRNPACTAPITADSKPSATCLKLLTSSDRATQQYELERRFAAFEAGPF
jgi:adenosine deaminase